MSGKLYRIGEAAALLKLKTYVLRFWEVEFSQIAPLRTEKGQRLYRDEDLAILRRIRYLLHERGLTIEGARRVLAEEAARGVAPAPEAAPLPFGHAGAPVPPETVGTSASPAWNVARDEDNEAVYRQVATELESIRSLLLSLHAR